MAALVNGAELETEMRSHLADMQQDMDKAIIIMTEATREVERLKAENARLLEEAERQRDELARLRQELERARAVLQ